MDYSKKTNKFILVCTSIFFLTLVEAAPVNKKKSLKKTKTIGLLVDKTNKYKSLKKFAQILHLIENQYIKNKNIEQLVNFSIKGLLSQLDPHSQYFSKKEYKEFIIESRGNFAGIGIELAYKKSQFIILSVVEGGPSEKAGIKAGDILFQVNSKSVDKLSMDDLSQKIRGKIGTSLGLKLLRGKEKKVLKFLLRRKIIKIKNVKAISLGQGYKYIKVHSFSRGVAQEVKKILKKSHNKKKILKGLILDLRFNPGGLLYEAVQLSDLFLSKGIIVQVLGRNKEEKEVLKARALNTYKNIKIIVLINAYSASASEIVAAALKDHKRALVMGETSFGKGSVQNFFPLEGGGAVKLTISQYYTPMGESIQTKGVVPNIHIKSVDSKLLKKAVLDKKVLFSEANLLSALKKEKNLKKITSQSSNIHFDFFRMSDCKKGKYKKACKLLNQDFSVLQAFNYLKILSSVPKM